MYCMYVVSAVMEPDAHTVHRKTDVETPLKDQLTKNDVLLIIYSHSGEGEVTKPTS